MHRWSEETLQSFTDKQSFQDSPAGLVAVGHPQPCRAMAFVAHLPHPTAVLHEPPLVSSVSVAHATLQGVVILYVGGIVELFSSSPKKEAVYLKQRAGLLAYVQSHFVRSLRHAHMSIS